MGNRYLIRGLVLIVIGGAGLLLLSSRNAQTPHPGWAPWIMGPGMMGRWFASGYLKRQYDSNGERIYYTGVGRTGRIAIAGGPMWVRMHGTGCVTCHGVRGHGGVPVMMGTAIPSDVRYEALTTDEHGERQETRKHPRYTDPLIKRAITEGVDPAGNPLDWTMPRWRLSEEDFGDLLAYLKTLK